MANIQARRDKDGKLTSFSIRVHRGRDADGKQLKPYTTTFDVKPGWSEKTARKKAEVFAANFEKDCKSGLLSDNRMKFAEYCDYVIKTKEARGLKHSTVISYRGLTKKIYPAIGHIKLKDIRADHLNSLYTELGQPGGAKSEVFAFAKVDLAQLLKTLHITRKELSERAGLTIRTVYNAVDGEKVKPDSAQRIAAALNMETAQLFRTEEKRRALSPKSIIEHHRLISTVLDQAEKEGLVPFNVARKATLPKRKQKEIAFFEPDVAAKILQALETEPIKWRTITHLFLITGARRGEIMGLKWDAVDFEQNRLHIRANLLYAPDVGVYLDTPKTEKSVRYISVPPETMELLKEYRAWQCRERLRMGAYYKDAGFVFTQDDGKPLHPDSATDWMNKFSARHGLPHLHPHQFRHSMASILFYNGVDAVSVARRLGHAQVSTTTNIYAHVMAEADQHNAQIIEDVYLKKA